MILHSLTSPLQRRALRHRNQVPRRRSSRSRPYGHNGCRAIAIEVGGFSPSIRGAEGMPAIAASRRMDISRGKACCFATFAGWYAQQRFCVTCAGLACPDFAHPGMRWTDWWGAGETYWVSWRAVRAGSREGTVGATFTSSLWMNLHGQVIEFLANALLAKEWEPVKLFESGWKWAKDTTAKYVTGEEAVLILAECGTSGALRLAMLTPISV